MKKEENYYQLLKVDPRASTAEIVTAYHVARNAFSKDSLAVYSLFSAEETEGLLKQLEEAYFTLSNPDRKRDYDRRISMSSIANAAVAIPTTDETPTLTPTPTPAAPAAVSLSPAPVTSTGEPSLAPVAGIIDGQFLAHAREGKGLSLDDVARLTKIPSRTLKAIEAGDIPRLPARVYLQGFVTNLAKVYRLDPAVTSKGYLENLDRLLTPPKV